MQLLSSSADRTLVKRVRCYCGEGNNDLTQPRQKDLLQIVGASVTSFSAFILRSLSALEFGPH